MRREEKRSDIGYCVAFNYDTYLDTYDIDLRRTDGDRPDTDPAPSVSADGMQQLKL